MGQYKPRLKIISWLLILNSSQGKDIEVSKVILIFDTITEWSFLKYENWIKTEFHRMPQLNVQCAAL